MRATEDDVRRALALLDVPGFDALGSQPEPTIAWQGMQANAKVNHRRLALAAHPDRGGSTERMAALNDAFDIVARYQYVPVRVERVRFARVRRDGDPFGRPLDARTLQDVLDAVNSMNDLFGRAGTARQPDGIWDSIFARDIGRKHGK